MSTLTACALAFAVALVLINLNYSLLALALYRLREGHWPAKLPLGIPLLATLAIAWAGWSAEGALAVELLVVLLLADSGGPVWWLGSAVLRRLGRAQQAQLRVAVTPPRRELGSH